MKWALFLILLILLAPVCADSVDTSVTIEEEDDDDDDGGGGGGGGGAGGLPVQKISANLYENDEATIIKSQGFIVKFTADGSNIHTITFDKVTDAQVTVTISSDTYVLTLGIGDSQELVLDTVKFSITLESIKNGNAKLVLKKLGFVEPPTTQLPEQIIIPEQEAPQQTQPETESRNLVTGGAPLQLPASTNSKSIVIILAAIVVFYLLARYLEESRGVVSKRRRKYRIYYK